MAETNGLLQATFDQPLTPAEFVQNYLATRYSPTEIIQLAGEQEAANIANQQRILEEEQRDYAATLAKTPEESVGDAILNFTSGAVGGATGALALITSALEDSNNPRNSDLHNFFVDTTAKINEAPLRHGSEAQLASQRSYARRMEAVNRRTAREYQQNLAEGATEGTATLARMGREAVEGGKAAWASGNYSQIVAQGLGSLATDIMLSRGMTGLSSVGKTAVKLAGGEEKLATLAKRAFDAAPPGIQKSAEWLRKNVPWMHSVAIQEGGGVYVDQYQKGLRMSFDELKAKSPEFNALVARLVQEYKEQGYSDEDALASAQERARAILASKSAWDASIGVAGTAAITSLLTKGLQKPFTANPRGALATIAEALGEPLEESIQEGYGQYRQNLATQKYLDRTQDVMEGVGQSIAEGAIGGLGIVAPRTAIASAQLLGDAPGSAYDASIRRRTKKETEKFSADLQAFSNSWKKDSEELRKTNPDVADKLDKNLSVVSDAVNKAIDAYSNIRTNFGLHSFDSKTAADAATKLDEAYQAVTGLQEQVTSLSGDPEKQKQLNALLSTHAEALDKAKASFVRSAKSAARHAIRDKGVQKLTPDDLASVAVYFALSGDYSAFKDEVLNLVTPDKFENSTYKTYAAYLQAQRLIAKQQARQSELQKEQEKAAQETTTATVDPTVLTEQPAPAPTPTPTPVQPQSQQQQTQPSQPVPQQQPRTPFNVENYKKKNPHRFNQEGYLINDDDLSDEDLRDLANSGPDWIETFGAFPSDGRAPNALSASERRNFVKERIKINQQSSLKPESQPSRNEGTPEKETEQDKALHQKIDSYLNQFSEDTIKNWSEEDWKQNTGSSRGLINPYDKSPYKDKAHSNLFEAVRTGKPIPEGLAKQLNSKDSSQEPKKSESKPESKNSEPEVEIPPMPEDFDPFAQGVASDETTKPSAQTESSIRTKGDSLVKSRLDQIRSSGVELTLSQVLSVIQTVNKDLSEQDKCTWKAEDITAYIEGKMSHPEISVKAPEPSEAQISEADMEEGKQLAERFCSAGSLQERQQVAEEAGKKHFIVKMEIDTETGEYYFPKASPKEQTEVKFTENLPSIFSRLFVPVKRMFYLWGSGTANPVGYLVQHLTSLKLLDKLLGGADSTATRGLKSKLLKKADLSGIRWLKEDELRSKGEDHLPDAHDPLIVQVLTALDPKGRLFQGLEQAMVQRLANGVKYAQFPKLIKNGKLNQKTKEIMQIIMVQWIASMTAGTSEATAEELAHLGLLLENDSDTVYLGGEVAPLAMAALVNMTKEFFGITENIENSNDRSAMEQETLIAEMANFMANIVEDAGFISRETAKVDARTVDDSEISTHELPIVTVRDDLKGIFKQDKFVLKHLCCSMQNREIYINEAPKAREHINIAHTPVAATEEQKLAVRAEETRAKKVNKAYLGLQLALGGLRGSFAVQKPLPIAGDRAFSNQEDFKSKEGQLLSRWLAFNYMASVFLELPKGMNIDDIDLYFKATVWKNSRIGLVGSVNPQSNKPLRAFIHEKLGPVDLTDKNSQAYTDWFIALASNLGESTGKKDISTYRKNVENFIARVREKVNKDPVLKSVFRKAFMASEDKNLLKLAGVEDISGEAFTLTAEETQAYKDFLHELQYGDEKKNIPGFDYEMLGDQQQNALLEVVRYVSIQDADYPELFKDQQLRNFDSNLSLEIDGNNDGPAHANKGWGLLIGAYTLAQGYMQAKTGYYEGTRTTTQANLTSVKDGGTESIYGHGNQDSHKQVAEKGVVDKLREFFTHLKADNETAKKEGNRSSQTNYTRVLSSMEGLLTIMGHIRGYQNKAGSDTWIIPNSGNPNDIPKVIQDFLRTGSPDFHFSTSLTKALVTIINYGSRAHGSTLQVITAMEEKLQQAITTALGKMYDATGTLPEVYKSFLKDMREEEVVVFDTETTGEEGKPVDPMTVKLAQIHAQKYLRGKPVGQPFSVTIKLDKGSSELPKTIDGKVNPMIKYYESQEAAGKLVDEQKAIEDFYTYVGDAPVIGHNIKGFDAPLIKNRSKTRHGTDDRSFGFTRMYDTLEIARYVTNLQLDGYRLSDLARAIGIRKLDEAHLAQVDVENNYKVADTLVRMLDAKERELQNTPAPNEHAEFNIEGLNYTDLRKALLQLFSVAYDPRKGSWLPITEKELGEYIEGLPVNILTQEELRTENIQYDKKKRMAYIESRNEYDSEGRLKRDYDLIQNFRITAKGKEVLARALAKHFGQAAQSAVHEAIGDQSMRAMTIPMQVMSIFTCIQRGVEATEYVRNKGYKDSTAFEKEDSHQRVNNFMAQLTFSDGVKVVASKNQYRMSDKPIVKDADKDRQDYSVYRSNVFAGDTRISGGALAVQGTGDAAMVLKLNRICSMLGINLDIIQMFDGISIKPEYARVLGYLMNVADYYAQTQRRMDSILKNLGFLAKQLKHYGYAKEDASTEDAIIDCLIQLKNGKTFDGEDITDDYLDLKKALGLGEYGGIDGIIKRLVGMTEVNSTMNFDIFNKNSNFKGTRNSVDSELRADLKGIFAYYRSCWFNELVNNYAQKCLPGSMNHYSGISNCAFVYGNPVSVEEAKAVLDNLNTDNQFKDLTDLNAAYKNTIAMARLKAMRDDPAYAMDKPIIEHLIQERIQSKTKMLSDEQMRICQRDLRYSDTPIDDAYDNRKAIVDNIQAILGESGSQELKENAPSEESLREADKAAQQAEYEQRKQERELAKTARKEASKAEQEARKAEAQNWVLTKRQDASNPKAVYDVARDVFKRIADRYGNKRTLQRRLFDAIASVVLRLLPKNLDLVIVNDISRLPEHLRAQAAQNTEFSVIDVTSDGAIIYILNQDKSIKDPFQALSAAANQDFLAHEFTHAALTLGIKQIIAKGPQGDPEGYKAVMSLVKLMQDTFLAPVSGVSVDSVDLPRVLQIIKEYWEDINLGTVAVDPDDPGSVERLALAVDETIAYVLTNKDAFNYLSQHIHLNASEEEVQNLRSVFRNLLSSVGRVIKSAFKITRKPLAKYFDAWLYRDPTKPPKTSMENDAEIFNNFFSMFSTATMAILRAVENNAKTTDTSSAEPTQRFAKVVTEFDMSVNDQINGRTLYEALARAAYPHKGLSGSYLDKTDKVISKVIKKHEQFVNTLDGLLRPCFMPDQARDIALVTKALMFEDVLNPSDRRDLANFYADIVEQIPSYEVFLEDKNAATPEEQEQALTLYNLVTGRDARYENSIKKDIPLLRKDFARPALLLALMLSDPDIKESLSKLRQSKNKTESKAPAYSLKRLIETTENSLLDRLLNQNIKNQSILGKLDSATKQQQKLINNPPEDLAEKIDSMIFDWVNGAFRVGTIKFLEARGKHDVAETIRHGSKVLRTDAVGAYTDMMETFRHWTNKVVKNVNVVGWLSDVYGRVPTLQKFHERLKSINGFQDKNRKELLEDLPARLLNEFSRKLSRTERTFLDRILGATDITTLGRDEARQVFTDANKLNQAISKEEKHLVDMVGENQAKHYQKKAKELAEYLMLGKISWNLLTNATAISRSFGEREYDPQHSTVVHSIDRLATMYAIDLLTPAEKEQAKQFYLNETKGMNTLFDQLYDIKDIETKRVEERHSIKAFKGWRPRGSIPSGQYIIVPARQQERYESEGFVLIGAYQADSLDNSEPMVRMWTKVPHPREFLEGLFQNINSTAFGFQINNRSRGEARGTHISAVNTLDRLYTKRGSNKKNKEQFVIPMYDLDGSVIGYERSIPQEDRKYLDENRDIFTGIAQYRSRQEREQFAIDNNIEVIKDCWDDFDQASSSEKKNEFIDVAHSADPVIRQAWEKIDIRVKEAAKKYFGDHFYIRKDLVYTVLGYERKSLVDIYDEKFLLPSGCELALAGILDLVLGKKARHKVLNAEAALGGLTSYARDTIIIRSLKVPALNAVSNLIILRYSLNIPFREIIRLMKECYAETELYNRLYHQNQELKYRATKAENAALKDQYEKKIAMNETRMKNLSLYPLIQGGEYSTISSQGRVFEELEIGKQTIGDMLETVVDKMPKGLKTLGANALMTKNSEIFQLLTKAVNYTDWLCKGIGYKYLTEYSKYRNVRMEPHQANAIVSTLFVDYDQFTTPGREYLNRMGILWFMMYKYRIIPATILSMMMNPARTVFGAAAAEALGTGSLLTDNWITKTLTRDIGYSIGLGMIFRGIAMHPLAVLLGCLI